MTTTWAGLPAATGPLSPAPYVPTPAGARCDCDPEAGSCRVCDGTARDEREIERVAVRAAVDRANLMATDPAFRRKWLETFAPGPRRQEMAAHADRTYGQLPLGTVEQDAAA